MRFLWWRKPTEGQEVAKEALKTADMELIAARASRERAEEIGISLREIRRKNHITQSIFPLETQRKALP